MVDTQAVGQRSAARRSYVRQGTPTQMLYDDRRHVKARGMVLVPLVLHPGKDR
jgi:hypothetical protein